MNLVLGHLSVTSQNITIIILKKESENVLKMYPQAESTIATVKKCIPMVSSHIKIHHHICLELFSLINSAINKYCFLQ